MVVMAQQSRVFLTKTGITAGRACDTRAYMSLIQGRWGSAPPAPPTPQLIGYRARHFGVSTLHRLWMRRGRVDGDVLVDVWSDAWRRAGGEDDADEDGLSWLRGYVEENPFLGPDRGRAIVGVEMELTAPHRNRLWKARPDLLVTDQDGLLCALELSSARHPTIDRLAVETMSAIDLVTIRAMNMPAHLEGRPLRIIVCGLLSGREIDVTLEWEAVERVLSDIGAWLDALSLGNVGARPSPDTCTNCRFRLAECPHSWLSTRRPLAPLQIGADVRDAGVADDAFTPLAAPAPRQSAGTLYPDV